MAVFAFTVRNSRVVGIDVMSDPEILRTLDLQPVPRPSAAGAALNPAGEGEPTP
jgi:hypothetical protein